MDLPKESNSITEKDSDSVMAKSQLTRTKDFVDMLIPIIEGMDDMEPWVQAKITKAEDYLNAVLNYYKGKGGVNEAKLSTVHRAAKKGSYPAVIVVVQDGKVIHQEPVSTPDVAPATFNVMQKEYPKALLHLEDRTGKRLFSESLDEGVMSQINTIAKKARDAGDFTKKFFKEFGDKIKKSKESLGWVESLYDDIVFSHAGYPADIDEFVSEGFDIEKLHFEMNPKKAEKLKIELGKSHGEIGKRKQIESGNYSLRKFRKTIGYWNGNKKDTDFAEDVFAGPEHYMTVRSTLGAGPHKKKIKKVNWNSKEYNKWLKTMATDNDGVGQDSSYGFEMAQNAEFEPGLIDWVKKSFRGEDPLQRIQWDIEGMMESVNLAVNEAEKYITNEYKVGDKIKTDFGEWEVIETDYKPGKSFIAPFIFTGKDMERANIPNPPKTNKKAVGYKVTDGDKYPITGFLYQYKGKLGSKSSVITKLATVGIDESVNESINEGKVTKKSISKASDDLARIIIELKDNLGKLQKSKTDEERAKYIEIAKDLTIKRKDASESLNLAIAKLDKNAELDLNGKD